MEGSYGIPKDLATFNWGHGHHHLTGLAMETLVAYFAAMAHNFHIQRTHAAPIALTVGARDPVWPFLPTTTPTQTIPVTPPRQSVSSVPIGVLLTPEASTAGTGQDVRGAKSACHHPDC